MASSASAGFYIFRDGRSQVQAAELIAQLKQELGSLPSHPQLEQILSLLLRAGELECALHDAASPDAITASTLTDLLAQAAVEYDTSPNSDDGCRVVAPALRLLDNVRHSGTLTISTPEGFAYYALHPLDYADLVERSGFNAPCCFVVGIRSIGTTLSAVVAAKFHQLRIPAERTTARPAGDPYDRRCAFDTAQRERIARALARGAMFLVCDEGPGRSGSSFLSVAEALEREGVPQTRIVLLCSHEPDADALCAPDGKRRWQRYRSFPAGMTRRLPEAAGEYLGGGEWRRKLSRAGEPGPALWPQMEPLQYLSAAGAERLVFEGHGRYGAEVRARNVALAECGFASPYRGQSRGFGRHVLRNAHRMRARDITPALLTRMADYCAWRVRQFPVNISHADELANMTQVNFGREFGSKLEDFDLPIEHAVICDAAMQPYTWLRLDDQSWVKIDGAIHGDNHFFPGACDIAWDLAGVVIEWELRGSARDFFLAEYRRSSGDNALGRIESYELAYAMFRLAWCKMAAASLGDAIEAERLLCECRRYRLATTERSCVLTRV